jgi:hypothetical protein
MLGIHTMFLLVGVTHLLRYSEKVRLVDFLGISAGGVTCGAALAGIIISCLALTGRISLGNKKPAQAQSVPEKTAGALP